MSDLTNYAEKKVGDHALGLSAWTMPTLYLSAHTADPTDSGSLAAEVTATDSGYARQNATAHFGAVSSPTGVAVNVDIIQFGPSSGANGAWGSITHVGYCDDATAGAENMVIHVAMSAARLIQLGDSVTFDPSQLSVTFA